MEEYQSEEFIEKYVQKEKHSFYEYDLKNIRTKLNRIIQKDNLFFDHEACLIKTDNKENETRICNFFVVPTHTLYFDNGEQIIEVGIAVELYSQFKNEKYKHTFINLSDEAIRKGSWLNSAYIDRDLFVYKPDLYRYLRIAINLSSRIIKKGAKKVFYQGMWLEDAEAVDHIFDSQHERNIRLIRNRETESESSEKQAKEAKQFLEAQRRYITKVKLLPYPEKQSEETDEYGWEDDSYYYLIYKDTWSWILAYFKSNSIKLQTGTKKLDHYLVEAGVFESNEERNNMHRADRNIRAFDKRVFMINKVRFNEFLSQE